MYAHEGLRHPSMNLGQAVAVCLWEMVRDGSGVASEALEAGYAMRRPERVFGLLQEVLEASEYTRRHAATAGEAHIRRLVHRMALTRQDGAGVARDTAAGALEAEEAPDLTGRRREGRLDPQAGLLEWQRPLSQFVPAGFVFSQGTFVPCVSLLIGWLPAAVMQACTMQAPYFEEKTACCRLSVERGRPGIVAVALCVSSCAGGAFAQGKQLTKEDYSNAERYMIYGVNSMVYHTMAPPTFLPERTVLVSGY